MKLVKESQLWRYEFDKKPKTDAYHIGLEIEFCSPYLDVQVAELINEMGLKKIVTLKKDSSIETDNEDDYPHEINILMKEVNYKRILRRICLMLKNLEAKVNSSCGLHVHLDMRNRNNKERIFFNLVYAQPLLYALNPGRIDGDYSYPTVKSNLSEVARDRTGINPCALREHNTIEIRIHEGTVDYKRISNWVELLLSIVYTRGYKRPASLDECIEMYKLDANVTKYVKDKMKKHGRKYLSEVSIDGPEPQQETDEWGYRR